MEEKRFNLKLKVEDVKRIKKHAIDMGIGYNEYIARATRFYRQQLNKQK